MSQTCFGQKSPKKAIAGQQRQHQRLNKLNKLSTKNIAQLNAKFGNESLTCLIPAKGLQHPQSHCLVTNRHLNAQTCLDLFKHDQIDRPNTEM